MKTLTRDFLDNRGDNNRYKRFFVPGVILLLIAASVALGFYLLNQANRSETHEADSLTGTLPSSWLVRYFGTDDVNDPAIGGIDGDPDGDFLSNLQEFYFNTDPSQADSDGDGQIDSAELATNSNPLGEGQIYHTQTSEEIAGRFYENNNLTGFTKEDIQRQIEDLLNPPSSEELDLNLPDESQLVVLETDTEEQVKIYFDEINKLAADLGVSTDTLINLIENPSLEQSQIVLGNIYELVDRLRLEPVPRPFLKYHQAQIAALLAAAKVFESQGTISSSVDLEYQKDLLQKQYYQVALIAELEKISNQELRSLSDRYPTVININS